MPEPAAVAEVVEITAAEPGAAARAAVLLEAALLQAVAQARPGAPARLRAMNLELAAEAEGPFVARGWVERATRTLAFATAELWADERRVASAGGVFDLG